MTSGKVYELSVPQFPHAHSEDDSSTFQHYENDPVDKLAQKICTGQIAGIE